MEALQWVPEDTLIKIDADSDKHVSIVPSTTASKKKPHSHAEKASSTRDPSLFVPHFHEVEEDTVEEPFALPSSMMKAGKIHLDGRDYDADSDDEAFVQAWNEGSVDDKDSIIAWFEYQVTESISGNQTDKKRRRTRPPPPSVARKAGKPSKRKDLLVISDVEEAFQILEDEQFILSSRVERERTSARLRAAQQHAGVLLKRLCDQYAELVARQGGEGGRHGVRAKGSRSEDNKSCLDVCAGVAALPDASEPPGEAAAEPTDLHYEDAHARLLENFGEQEWFEAIFEYWSLKRAIEGGSLLRCYQTVSDLSVSVAKRIIGPDQVLPLPKSRFNSSDSEDEEDREDISEERKAALLVKRLSNVRSRARDIEANARAMVRLRRLRQQLERFRLLVDLTRKREKLKREKTRQFGQFLQLMLYTEEGGDGAHRSGKRARSGSPDRKELAAAIHSMMSPSRPRSASFPESVAVCRHRLPKAAARALTPGASLRAILAIAHDLVDGIPTGEEATESSRGRPAPRKTIVDGERLAPAEPPKSTHSRGQCAIQ